MKRVLLIRHGRSSHVHEGWLDRETFLRWREAYEAAGIDDAPPENVRDLVANSMLVAASDSRRAIESAKALAPDREVVTSDLFRELELHPPSLGRLVLPMWGWLIAFIFRWVAGGGRMSAAERERVDQAAEWIEQQPHDSIAIVTHGTFRRALAPALIARGWRKVEFARGHRHWSAWALTK